MLSKLLQFSIKCRILNTCLNNDWQYWQTKTCKFGLELQRFYACERCKKQGLLPFFAWIFFYHTKELVSSSQKSKLNSVVKYLKVSHTNSKYESLISTSMLCDNNYKEMQNNILKSCIIYLLLIAESRVHGMFVAPRTSTSLLSTPTPSVKM